MIGGLIGQSTVRISTYARPTSISTNAPASTSCGREVCGPPPPPPPLVVVQATPSPQQAPAVVVATPYRPPPPVPVVVTATPSPPALGPGLYPGPPPPPPPPPSPPLTRSYTRGGGGGTVTSAPPLTPEAPVADIVPSSSPCPTGLSWPGVAAAAGGGFVLGLILGIVSGRMPKSKRRR
jgi:hypothetical protein